MTIPGFHAEVSLYRVSEPYGAAGSPGHAAGVVHPAIIVNPCIRECKGDSLCVQCCECIRHGGKPWQCCF